jgi:hypothetical protein
LSGIPGAPGIPSLSSLASGPGSTPSTLPSSLPTSGPGSWSGVGSLWPFGSSSASGSGTSPPPLGSSNRVRSPLFTDDVEPPLRPLTGPARPATLDPNLGSTDFLGRRDPFASAIGHSSGSADELHDRFGGW